VVEAFCEYWPTGKAAHVWLDPKSALMGSMHVQIRKTKGNRSRRRFEPERLRPDGDIGQLLRKQVSV
jgi:hypothetical protein